MPTVLLVEDDPSQLETRRLLLERAGYEVTCAATVEEASASLKTQHPDSVVMDLRLPKVSDGRRLIRQVRKASPDIRIVVLSGYPEDLEQAPEKGIVAEVLRKPLRSQRLIDTLRRLAVLLVVCGVAAPAAPGPRFEQAFTTRARREAVAAIEASVPGCDWRAAGREAALLNVQVDNGAPHQVMLFAGGSVHPYEVFLGPLEAGAHRLVLSAHPDSAPACKIFDVRQVRVRELDAANPDDWPLLHAPAVHARANTIGQFTDVPLASYYQRNGNELLYTVIFSNEDGGHSSRGLMARYGRTTDIEWVYRVWLNPDGSPQRAIVQGRNHKDIGFTGERVGFHPLLTVTTQNNMVGFEGRTPVRYQLTPLEWKYPEGSRERFMDDHPALYAAAAAEMEREGKFRAPGTVDGEKITDPRHYVIVEAEVEVKDGVIQALVETRNAGRWAGSSTGVPGKYIDFNGWVRFAVEVAPGTTVGQVSGLGFECGIKIDPKVDNPPASSTCTVKRLGKVFLLDESYRPGPAARVPAGPWHLRNGETVSLRLP